MRRYFLATAAAIMAVGLVHPVASASPAPARQPGPALAPTETNAVRQAQQTGQPVEITDQTTETRQVIANPNGTFTLKSNQRAVRVKRNGTWTPIDTTLRRNPDGTLTPAATDQDITFSGGGTTPAVTIRRDGKALAFAWPTPLPAPTVSGDTVTYPAVLPGVDLQLRAQADSYSQVLVVRDAESAANPALAHIQLTATGTGITLTTTSNGDLSATDPAGVEVLRGPAPLMWDSRHDDPLSPAPSATEPGSGLVTPVAVTSTQRTTAQTATATSATDLTLTPDPAKLSGIGVVYPVYIDPGMSSRKWHWLEVTDSGWAYYDANQLAQVGYCSGWDGCGTPAWRARSYFQLDISPLWYRNNQAPAIWRAEFFATQVWAADHRCNDGQPTRVYESGGFDGATRWPGTAGVHLDTQYSNAGGPCPASNLKFNVWLGARHASDQHWSGLFLGLIADNENDPLQWKKFDNNPLLEVDYSFPPNRATPLSVSNEVRCTGSPITSDARPTLHATATDNNDPPLQLAFAHEVWDSTGTTRFAYTHDKSSDVINSGGIGQWRVPATISDGDYVFISQTFNLYPGDSDRSLGAASWSEWYRFTVRATPPVTPAIVSTMDYPDNYWGAPVGAPGAIGVSANGAAHVAGYTYTFAGSGTETVPNTNDCNYHRTFGDSGGWIPHHDLGTNWIPIPAGLRAGRQTLHVRSFDDAHNLSPETSYTFYVPPSTGLSTQRFEAENLPRSQPAGQNVLLEPGYNCCNITWSGGAQLNIFGNAVGQSFTASFTTTLESDYQIAIGLTKSFEYGQFALRLDGQPIGQQTPTQPIGSLDAFAPTPFSSHQPLGIRHLAAGTHALTFTSTGTNPESIGLRYALGIDYVDLTQTTRYEAEDSAQLTRNQDSRLVPQTNTSGEVAWSNASQLAFLSNTNNSSFDLTFRTPVEADYALGANLTKANDYGTVTFLLDDKPLLGTDTAPWDGYSPTVTSVYKPLGGSHLTAGLHKLTLKVVGTNPATINNRYQAGVDYLSLVPVNNVTAANFTAAMNNQGISSDPTTGTVSMPATLPRAGWTVTADSEQSDQFDHFPARHAIDGDPNTFWHTQFLPTVAGLPHTLTIDTHATNTIAGLRYQNRTDHPNGRIGNYQIHLSTNGTTWGTPIATGTFPDNTTEQAITFTPTTARYIRLTALTEAGNRGPWSTAAEINLTPGFPAGVDLAGNSLSTQTLAAAGYAPGATANVGGATFTMPAARADGMDNVIALGQTIPFPTGQQIKASAVGLLVAATCGATPDASGTITYTDNSTQNTPVARVEDWIGMPTDLASVVLPHHNDGTATNPALRPRILAVFPPADPTRTLKSITLPNYGTSLLPGSCSPALHVLAIAPRPAVAGWVGAWTAHADTAKPAPGAGLADKTVRSVVHPTVTGPSVRVRVTNPTNTPVTIDAASLAAQTGTGATTLAAPVALKFGGSNAITLPAAGEATSDPMPYPATTGGSGNLLVSLHLPTAVTLAPIHAESNAPTYLASGNVITNSTGTPFTTSLTGSSYLSALEVSTSDTTQGTVAVLGDQFTAMAPPGSAFRPTWVDDLPSKLANGGVPLPGGLVNASLAGLPAAGSWRLDDGSGTTARDSAGSAPATATGAVSWSGDHGGSVSFNGTGSLATSAPVVGTATNSYSVSAWVKLTTTGTAAQTIVSQDGAQGSAFALQYTGTTDNRWAFTLFSSTGASSARVLSTNPVQTGIWTHVFGVYNTASGMAELYVNGEYQGYATHLSAFAAIGPLAIGRGKANGSPAAFLTGAVSDVRVYERAGNGWDAKILTNGGPATGPQPGLGAPTATDANRTLDRTVLNQPRLRTVIVALGANDILAGRTAASIEAELTEIMHQDRTSPTGIRNTRRADGTRVHVIVTTVPPLGLADNDPREQQRRQLNADILAHYLDYGAHERIDFAASVQDPANPNQTNPTYLTTGMPNNAYHDAIAQAIADAATRFPPEAQL